MPRVPFVWRIGPLLPLRESQAVALQMFAERAVKAAGYIPVSQQYAAVL